MTFLLDPYRQAAALPFDPDSVTGLQLWIAADTSTLWQDYLRTTPATADGDRVAAIDDLSGNALHVTQGGDLNTRSTLKSSIINGKRVLRFDGVDDFMYSPAWTSMPQPNTVFFVHKFLTVATVVPIDGIAGGNRHILGYSNGGNFHYFAGSTEVSSGVASDTAVHLHTAVFNGASSKYRIDRVQRTTTNPGTNPLTGMRVGSNHAGSGFANFDLAEVLIYAGQKTGTEIDNIETYLRTRWGTP